MDITKVVFPLYKLRSYIDIDKNPLGLVKITTIRGTYILDDESIDMPFESRRVKLIAQYPEDKIYKLKEKVRYLRQLVKYKSGTTFIDFNGTIIKYNKSSKLFTIKSHKIVNKRSYKNWNILTLSSLETPFLIAGNVGPTITHASVMETKWGPFLYDITNKHHEPYKRKI